jgi:hypothetical protein
MSQHLLSVIVGLPAPERVSFAMVRHGYLGCHTLASDLSVEASPGNEPRRESRCHTPLVIL